MYEEAWERLCHCFATEDLTPSGASLALATVLSLPMLSMAVLPAVLLMVVSLVMPVTLITSCLR